MLLTADRLEVAQANRIHAGLIVTTPMLDVLTAGGIDALRHELEDVGFREVRVFLERPSAWTQVPEIPRPDGLEWVLFAELVAAKTASYQRQLTANLRVADAWDACVDDVAFPNFHPYSAALCAAARFAGAIRAFATAYLLEVL